MTAEDLAKDSVWLDKSKYDEAERAYYEKLNKVDGFQDLPSTSISNDMSEVVRKLQTDYNSLKSEPAVIAKSMIIFDVKPWDDETDMKAMEVEVRKIAMDGLLWGSAKLVPLAYGIHKLQIASVVEDDKVSVDDISDKIQEIEDFVQSVDIAAFNKI